MKKTAPQVNVIAYPTTKQQIISYALALVYLVLSFATLGFLGLVWDAATDS